MENQREEEEVEEEAVAERHRVGEVDHVHHVMHPIHAPRDKSTSQVGATHLEVHRR